MMGKLSGTNQKGVSLLEFLVVITILAIVVTTAVTGFSFIASGNAKKASKTIHEMLLETRSSTMSVNAGWEARISNQDGQCQMAIYKNGEEFEMEKIGSRIELSYDDMCGTAKVIEDKETLIICFSKSSGVIENISYQDAAGVEQSLVNKESASFRIQAKASEDVYQIDLWYDTGKVTYDE